jgi:hypothetical protein
MQRNVSVRKRGKVFIKITGRANGELEGSSESFDGCGAGTPQIKAFAGESGSP